MCSQSWANELVAAWCSSEAAALRRKAGRIRKRYRYPMAEAAGEFADMLERHALGWDEKSRQLADLPKVSK